jgi:4-hydroxy-tetrahydrodipicolinate reductase
MTTPIRVIQYGLGAIGRAAATLARARPGFELVGAVDLNPANGHGLGVPVTTSLPDIEADAVIHCTGSSFAGVYEQLAEIVQAGLCCVTSCEEAMFPYYRHKDLAHKLNNLCVSNSVSLLGTGVNPGFVMDTLPVVLTAVSQRVDFVRVLRVVDAGTRREALRRKIGAGLTREEFDALAQAGKIRHVGLPESLAFIADALGWDWQSINETIEPVLRGDGRVAGVRQVARAGNLELELQMHVGAQNPRDEIEIAGKPPLRVVIAGGTAGDIATPAILVNMLPILLTASPGLHTMRTLSLPGISRQS